MVQLKSNTEEGSTLSTLGAVLTLRPCNTFFFLGVHISHCQVQPSPFTIPKMSCCLDTLKCVLTYNVIWSNWITASLYTLTIPRNHTTCCGLPIASYPGSSSHKRLFMWRGASVRGQFTNVSSLLLRCASLIPRPLPDYISQPWRKIVGSKLCHRPEMVDSVSTNQVHVMY